MDSKRAGFRARKHGTPSARSSARSDRRRALAVGVAAVCVVAAVVLGARSPLETSAFAAAPGSSGRKAPAGGPGCLYGQVVDGHSGDVRCLSPAEVTPSAPYDTPADRSDAGSDSAAATDASPGGRRDAGFDSSVAIPLKSISVLIEGLTFESGDVPRAPIALDRIKKDFSKCVGEGALKSPEATVEVRFLVRAPGRAEGVDVVQSRGMSADVVRCVASSLAGRAVGAPTSDPVGVTLTVRFKKD